MNQTPPLLASFVLALLLLGAPAYAADADETATPQVGLQLEGRLGSRVVTRDGKKLTLYLIRVGKTTYELTTRGIEAEALRKLKGKYVTLRSAPQEAKADGDGDGGVVLAEAVSLVVQEQAPLAGTVRKTAEGKKIAYALETGEGLWQVSSGDARRFKAFVDQHVEAVCFRVTDGRYHALDKVKDVARKLLPGERDPQAGEEAIGAAWKGTLTAVKAPKGIPGVEPGDFPIAFRSDAALKDTEGKLMGSYEVVGLRARKFNRKKRTAVIEVAYSFGQGSYAIMLEGVFGADWKTFTGDWKSGFLGSGTFRLMLHEVPAK